MTCGSDICVRQHEPSAAPSEHGILLDQTVTQTTVSYGSNCCVILLSCYVSKGVLTTMMTEYSGTPLRQKTLGYTYHVVGCGSVSRGTIVVHGTGTRLTNARATLLQTVNATTKDAGWITPRRFLYKIRLHRSKILWRFVFQN